MRKRKGKLKAILLGAVLFCMLLFSFSMVPHVSAAEVSAGDSLTEESAVAVDEVSTVDAVYTDTDTIIATEAITAATGEATTAVTTASMTATVAASTSGAQIGDIEYSTLTAALKAAKSGDTIQLLKNTTLSVATTIPEDLDITIDLNGYSISRKVTNAATTSVFVNNGTLTITDTSETQTGKISVTASFTNASYYVAAIQNAGTLNLEGGIIEVACASTTTGKCIFYGVVNTAADACIVLDGATVNVTKTTAFYDTIGLYNLKNGASIELRSGSVNVSSKAAAGVVGVCTASGCSQSSILMTGGEISVIGTGTVRVTPATSTGTYTCYGINAESGSTTISGGTVSVDSTWGACGVKANAASPAEISNLALEVSSMASAATATSTADYYLVTYANISGGTYTMNDTSVLSAALGTGVSVSGGTYTENIDVLPYLVEGYTTVDNGDGTYTVVEEDTTVYVAQIGKSVYETLSEAFADATDGCTILLLTDVTGSGETSGNNGLYQVSGIDATLDLNGYELTSDAGRIFGVLEGGSLTVKNGKVTSTYTAISAQQTLIILRGNSSFTAEEVTFDANSSHSYLIWTTADDTVQLTTCTVENGKTGVVNDNAGTASVTFTGCTYHVTPINGNNVSEYTIIINGNGGSITPDSGSPASEYGTDDWIRLDYNYIVGEGGVISTTANIYLRNNKGEASLTINGGTVSAAYLEVRDTTTLTVEEENGSLTLTGKLAVLSGGTLQVNSGTVTCSQIQSSGEFTMTDGVVKNNGTAGGNGLIYATAGTITISGGSVLVDSNGTRGVTIDNGVTGSISGGTFSASEIGLLTRGSTGPVISGGTYIGTTGLYTKTLTVLAEDCAVYDTAENTLTPNSNGQYKSTQTDQTVIVKTIPATTIELGVSDDPDAVVKGILANAEGGNTEGGSEEESSVLYVEVSAEDLSAHYDTDSYPTTSYTFINDDGETQSYIFAGWYSFDEDEETYLAYTTFPTETSAYAKFVDADTLCVKGVVTSGSEADGDAGTNYWRFVTGLDSFNYDYIGFQVTFGDDTDSNPIELVGRCYTKYTVSGADNRVFLPGEFGSGAIYIATNVLTETTSATTCRVRAYWTTLDGTSVYGDWYSFSLPSSGYELSETQAGE